MDINAIKLEEVYTFTPKAVLDACGVREVKRQIKERWDVMAEFSDEFSWAKDNLAKRIVEDLGIAKQLNSDNMGWLGGILGMLLLPEIELRFRFSNNFGWEQGDYGDAGSCLFVFGHKAPKILQHNGAWAIQFLNSKNQGIGRCLIARKDDSQVIFNAYGKMYEGDVLERAGGGASRSRQDNKVSFVASLMNQFTGLDYRQVRFTINGSDGDPVYINNGTGYVLGPWKEIRLARSIDFRLDVDIFPKCDSCGAFMDKKEDLFETAKDSGLYGGYKKLCPKCKRAFETVCVQCGKLILKRDKTSVIADDGCYFCSVKCISEANYRKCADCERWINSGHLWWLNDFRKWVCDSCQVNYRSCLFCYKTVPIRKFSLAEITTSAKKVMGTWGCPTCIENIQKYGNPKGDPNKAEVEEVSAIGTRKKKVKQD